MNRYDWVMWAFRLLFSSEVINSVKKMVVQLEANQSKTGAEKREMIVGELKPMIGNLRTQSADRE